MTTSTCAMQSGDAGSLVSGSPAELRTMKPGIETSAEIETNCFSLGAHSTDSDANDGKEVDEG